VIFVPFPAIFVEYIPLPELVGIEWAYWQNPRPWSNGAFHPQFEHSASVKEFQNYGMNYA
jgi:hypothetical protein